MKLRVILKIISVIMTMAMVFAAFTAAIPGKVQAAEGKTALQSYVEDMQPGWNLGNTFDATGDETSWGNPKTTKELIDAIADAGFKSIRIPITWRHRMGDAPDYKIDEKFMARIQEVVDWCLDDGLYVMINLHHDSVWIMNMESQHDEVLATFKSAWVQISEHFKDYPDKLMFESINEPRFSEDWGKDSPVYFTMLDELNTSFHTIVRNSGGNNATRPLVLPGMATSGAQNRLDELNKTLEKLNDKNIIATIHYYGNWSFSVNIAGATKFEKETKDDMIQTFDRAYNTFVSKGIPVIVGEYGLLGFDNSLGTIEHGEMLKYMEYYNYYATEKGLTTMLWDNGQHFNRRTLTWGDESLYNVIMASVNGRSSTAETDSIYIKKDAAIEDRQIKLNLNGNTLVGIKSRDKALVKGTDYDIKDDVLTVKASLLKELITKEYGVNAVLSCEFSKGADWDIHIIYYDIPRMKSTVGNHINFVIPTYFYGDQLATMEAVYKSGGNAGPPNWTPYKQFDYCFTPLYKFDQIILKKEFFTEVKDGEVTLKMHFWSGDVVEYNLTREGIKITGVSTNEPEEEANDSVSKDVKEETSTDDTASQETVDNTSQDEQLDSDSAGEVFAQEDTDNTAPSENSSSSSFLIIGVIVVLILAGIGFYLMRRKNK